MYASGPFTRIQFVWRYGSVRIEIAVPLHYPFGEKGDLVNTITSHEAKSVYH